MHEGIEVHPLHLTAFDKIKSLPYVADFYL